MRYILIFLCCWGTARAQFISIGNDKAFVRYQEGLPAAEPFDTAQRWQKAEGPYQYIVSRDDLYNFFGYGIYSSFQDFDFEQYHILGIKTCKNCQSCLLHGMEPGCHANRCQYSWVWMIRDNDKAFRLLPSLTLPTDQQDELAAARIRQYRDTVVDVPGEKNRKLWYTNAGGDCHARFSYTLLQDKYFPTLLLKEWIYDGGCRAGGFWEFTIQFKQPDKNRAYIKRSILRDRCERD